MTGFEPRISGIVSGRPANWATTTAPTMHQKTTFSGCLPMHTDWSIECHFNVAKSLYAFSSLTLPIGF